jgi:hypothetical protein
MNTITSPELDNKKGITLLYLFHFTNNIAISVVANFLFIDKIFLRLGLDYSSIGFIKGLSFLIPMSLALLLSPYIQNLNRDREIIAVSYLFRVFLPLALLFVPTLELAQFHAVLLISFLLVLIHTFPMLANNCIQMLMRQTISDQILGKHITWINVLWTMPGFLLAIPLSRYIDLYEHASDAEFYRAMFIIMLATGVVQIISSLLILQLPRNTDRETNHIRPTTRDIMVPFKDIGFRKVLLGILCFSTLSSMVAAFINPYLLVVQHMSMTSISTIGAVVSMLSIAIMPIWGKILDLFGGKISYASAVIGFMIGVSALLAPGTAPVLLFAFCAWDGQRGCFGSGILAIQQYLVIKTGKPRYMLVYYSAASSMMGLGWFIGANSGGILIDLLRELQFELVWAYRVVFLVVALGAVLLYLIVRNIEDDNQHITSENLWIYLYRIMRNMFGRMR